MTWSEWVDSDYNTGGFYNSGWYISQPDGRFRVGLSSCDEVNPTDIIADGAAYVIFDERMCD